MRLVAGPDPQDNFTLAQPLPVPDYTKHLLKNALKGARIGVNYSVHPNQTDGNYPEYIL